MAYLDQSFSSKNFGNIYDLLNRRGQIDIADISDHYKQIVTDIKLCNEKIKTLKRKKRSTWTDAEKHDYETYKNQLSTLIDKKNNELSSKIEEFANDVNSPNFKFVMSNFTPPHDTHEIFKIDTSNLQTVFALNQINHNLKKSFNVEMANRHSIMTSLKHLLNTKMPIYVIRTDVDGFFEHIPQDKLMDKISNSNLLSYKTKSFIKQILSKYEQLKDTSKIHEGLGVPRGVSISSMLSEIYMQDLDRAIKSRKEVIFYARYVDDIFMITKSIYPYTDVSKYYDEILVKAFSELKLSLKGIGTSKCQLLDIINIRRPLSFDYLGYELKMEYSNRNGLITRYELSKKKNDKIIDRINRAYNHFEELCKINLKQARRDLLDSLKYIFGNIGLQKAKSGIKVGLYYNNDLLDDFCKLNDIEQILKLKPIIIPSNVFKTSSEETLFKERLKKKIDCIYIKENWQVKKMYKFSNQRINEIKKWL